MEHNVTVLRRKFIEVNAYIRKTDEAQINNLMIHLRYIINNKNMKTSPDKGNSS